MVGFGVNLLQIRITYVGGLTWRVVLIVLIDMESPTAYMGGTFW